MYEIAIQYFYYVYLLQAISLLENIGAKIHAVITDGAATNRKFWTAVGVCGKKNNLKNSFEHPTVNGSYVYIFSDISFD